MRIHDVGRPMPPRQRYWAMGRWLLVGLYASVIYLVSSVPGDDLPSIGVSDKILHAVEFAILAVLVCRGLRAQFPSRSLLFVTGVGILVCTGYGAADEVHQSMVAHRVMDVTDLLADGVGASLAAGGWALAGRHWPWLL